VTGAAGAAARDVQEASHGTKLYAMVDNGVTAGSAKPVAPCALRYPPLRRRL